MSPRYPNMLREFVRQFSSPDVEVNVYRLPSQVTGIYRVVTGQRPAAIFASDNAPAYFATTNPGHTLTVIGHRYRQGYVGTTVQILGPDSPSQLPEFRSAATERPLSAEQRARRRAARKAALRAHAPSTADRALVRAIATAKILRRTKPPFAFTPAHDRCFGLHAAGCGYTDCDGRPI